MRFVAAAMLAVVLGGCAYSMVEKGQLRSHDFRRILARTAATRGLPLPEHLDTQVVHRTELPRLLTQMFYDEWNEQELRDAQETLSALGLWPAGIDLLTESIRLQGDEIAGLYSPPRRTLYVVEGVEAPDAIKTASAMTGRDLFVEFVLSHEIVHALQHQAFPRLFEVTSDWKDQDDVVFALHAAIEGDALRYGFEVIAPDTPLPPVDEFVELQDRYQPETEAGVVPAVLRQTLVFPYAAGYPLSVAEGKHLLARPPVSTEQALHPAKRREAFAAIDLSAAHAALPPGCTLVAENTMGELVISILLRELGESVEAGAWEGWDGDRYLVASCAGRRQFIWMTMWDKEADAIEFAAAYETIAAAVQARAGLEATPRTTVKAAEVRVFTPGLEALAESIDGYAAHVRVANLTDLLAAGTGGRRRPITDDRSPSSGAASLSLDIAPIPW